METGYMLGCEEGLHVLVVQGINAYQQKQHRHGAA
mgnify:FL=1